MIGIVLDLVCLACDGSFSAAKPKRGRYPRFCSHACRRSRHLTQLQGYRAEGRYSLRSAPANRRPIAKACLVCDKPFETTNNATVCCGTICGQALRARRAGATRTARSVAERQRVCEHCQVPFVARHPSGAGIAGKVREGRFCSRSCAGAFRSARVAADLAASAGETGEPFLVGIVWPVDEKTQTFNPEERKRHDER
jgi:hypothetical protein